MSGTEIEPVADPPSPRFQHVGIKDGAITLTAGDEEAAWLANALGTESGDFKAYCLRELINILPRAGDEDFTMTVNAAVSMLSAINPRDELEAMLAVQMVASNHMALVTMGRAKNASLIESRQMNGNLATKFSRTFTAQLEALDRHRRGGKQIVEHVHVNAGGQAVIAGTVNTGGRGENSGE